MDQKTVNSKHCSYQCKYYQDGSVLSLCNKFNKQLKYEEGKPAALIECLNEFLEKG